MKKQTAIDWLVEQIFNDVDMKDSILKLAIQQAKEMEKEQHFELYKLGNSFLDSENLNFKDYFEQYYNENYGN